MDPDNSKCLEFKKKIGKFENLKEQANTAFKDKKYDEAISLYSDCLALDPTYKSYNAIIYSNRATGTSFIHSTGFLPPLS